MRVVLVGAVDSTRIALEKLTEHNVPPVALFTLPLSKSDRHSDFVHLQPLAQKYEVPVIEVSNINSPEALDKIRFLQPDYLFIIGWSQICRQELLSIPRLGSIGCHPAAIPVNRGRAVIPWTILQRCKDTAMTLFWLDEGADTGDILMQYKFPVASDETATTLCEKIDNSIAEMFCEVIPKLLKGEQPREKQNHQLATYCAKRGPDDGFIDWNLSAESIWTLIRAVTKPYPGAFSFYQGKKIIIWSADYIGDAPYWGSPGQVQYITENGVVVQCGDGKHILLKSVQMEDEPETTANLVLKNHRKLGINLLDLYRQMVEKECVES